MSSEPRTATAGGDEAGVGELLRRLTDQGAHLAQQQVALMQAEMQASVTELKAGAAAFAGAAVLGIAAIGTLLMALAFFLSRQGLELWAATLIVALAALVIAWLLYRGAASRTRADLTPTRTLRTLERTPDAATGKL